MLTTTAGPEALSFRAAHGPTRRPGRGAIAIVSKRGLGDNRWGPVMKELEKTHESRTEHNSNGLEEF